MNRIFSILAFLFLFCSLSSQDIRYRVYRVDKPPVIDGAKDFMWDLVPQITGLYAIKELPHETDPDDSMDCFPSFRMAWDDEFLYVYMEVYDDVLKKDGLTLGQDRGFGYNDDCFEIFLDGDYSHGDRFDGKNDCELWFLWEEDEIFTYISNMKPFSTETVVMEQQNWKDENGNLYGWSMEVAFPLELVDIPAKAGAIFGVDLKYGDDDNRDVNPDLGGTDREHNMRWNAPTDQHPPSSWDAVQLDAKTISERSLSEFQ